MTARKIIRAEVITDETSREIHIELSGDRPDMENRFHARLKAYPRPFRPEKAVVMIVDGTPFEIRVSGRRVMKDGTLSKRLSDHDRWNADDITTAPAWIQTVWNGAPIGVTSWMLDGS